MTTPYYQDEGITLHLGDALEIARTLPNGFANCIVTSPPYFGLRDYEAEGQYGLEVSPSAYVETLRALFSELRRVLTDDGTLWLNIGDTYSGYHGNKRVSDDAAPSNKPGYWENMRQSLPGGIPAKNMIGAPWRTALALQDDGWILRNEIIWHKAGPFAGRDRLASHHEHIFMFSKRPRYWFDLEAIKDGGRNPGDVWSVQPSRFRGAHFATFPPEIPRRAILAGCKPGGTVLDPFSGSGTTGMVARELDRKYVGIDISEDYLNLSLETRLQDSVLDLGALA